jgi:NhaP-type Na+/H+ or K+/H+ antiporter
MHGWQLAVLALVLLGYAAISGRIEGTSITAPMIFTAAGLLVGVDGLGLLDPSASGEFVKVLAEATLAVVLFSDASRIDLAALREEIGVPARLLGIGLPLTIVLGLLLALPLLPGLAWPEALVLAVVLAPTDAALGQAVVTNRRLPSAVRQSLNVESGLNDGICVPLFLVALSVAQAEEGAVGSGHAARMVLEKIGFGTLAGVGAGIATAAVVLVAGRRRWIGHEWMRLVPVAGAALAYGLAEAIGGSGFIGAFVGGLVFGGIVRRYGAEAETALEELGDLFSAVTFVVFGAILLGPAIGSATWQVVVYALLSLTVVRMAPVALAMLGTHARPPTVAFLGWFGPRGLASIVFALLLVEEGGLPGEKAILTTAFLAVGLSVLAHGVTATPLSRRYADWVQERATPEASPVETLDAIEVPWRHGGRRQASS